MSMEKNKIKNPIVVGTVLLIVAFVLFRFDALRSVVSAISSVLMPFIIGAVLALFISVPLRGVEIFLRRFVFKNTDSKSLYRGIALVITIVLVIIFMFFAIRSLIPALMDTVGQFTETLPQLIDRFNAWVERFSDTDLEFLNSYQKDLENISNGLRENLQRYVRSAFLGGVSLVSNTFSFVFTMFLAVSFSLYLLFYKETFGKQIVKALYAFLDENTAQVIMITTARFGGSFTNFISGLTMSSVLYGIMNFVAMLILRLPYRTSLSFLSVMLNFVPYFGPFLTGIMGFVLIGATNIQQGLIYIVLTVVLQQLESNLVYPRVVGDQVGLPGIWVMVSVTLGGAIMGLFGMLMAVPVATVIYNTLGDVVEYKTLRKESVPLDENTLSLSQVMNKNLIITLATPKSDKEREEVDEDLKEEIEKNENPD